jgi:hypothetical protein
MIMDTAYKTICLQQAEVIEQLSEMTKTLISELSQYRAVEEEEARLEKITEKVLGN